VLSRLQNYFKKKTKWEFKICQPMQLPLTVPTIKQEETGATLQTITWDWGSGEGNTLKAQFLI